MTTEAEIDIPTLKKNGTDLPTYSTAEAAGADVRAHLEAPMTLAPGKRALIPTGIQVHIPPGYEIQVRPRSGLALKHGISLVNSPGTIDSDYRGEIGVIIINHGEEPFTIDPGMRIAQLVLMKVERARFTTRETLNSSKRDAGGFGHTGTN